MNIPDGYEPAFPFACQGPTTAPETYYGLTMRDWFAGQALVSYSNWGGHDENGEVIKFSDAAADCYNMADAMIEERNRKP